MGDDQRKVHVGEPLAIPAAAYNAFVDAARAEQSRQGDQGVPGQTLPRESGVVLIKNTTESDLARFAVLGIDAPIFTPEDNEQEFKNRVALKGVVPNLDEHQLRFAVLLEPLAAGRIGLGMVQGVTPARLYVTNEGHRGAGMEEGKTGYLSSQASAYATTVLWKESGVSASEEDLKWAVVAFRGGGGEGGLGVDTELAEVVQIYNADGNVWASYAADGWQAYVEAYPIVRWYNEETEKWEWVPDAEVTLLLKLNAACGPAEVGFKDVAGGDWIGYVRATDNLDVAGRPAGTKFDGWVLLHGGDRGAWLSALQHAAGGPGIDVDEAADPFKPKIKVDLAPNPGLEFVGEGDAGKLGALPDRNRGLDLEAAGIFIDLADANPGLTFDGGDLKVLPDGAEGIKVDAEGVGVKIDTNYALQMDADAGIRVNVDENYALEINAADGIRVKVDPNGPLFISGATGNLDLGIANLGGLTIEGAPPGNLKAHIDTDRGVYFEAGKIAVNLETTNLEFDGGAVKHKQDGPLQAGHPVEKIQFRVDGGVLQSRIYVPGLGGWMDWVPGAQLDLDGAAHVVGVAPD